MNRLHARGILALIVVANCLIYVLSLISPDLSREWFLVAGSTSSDFLPSLATYSFVHSGFLHLLFNMIVLWWCGESLIKTGGIWTMLLSYIVGGIVGGVGFLVFAATDNAGVTSLCGASAAVLGTAGGLWPGFRNKTITLLNFLKIFRIQNAGNFVIKIKGRYILAGILIMTVVTNPVTSAVVTHCCGFAGGLVVTVISLQINKRRRVRFQQSSEEEFINSSDFVSEDIFRKVRVSGYDSLTVAERKKIKN